MFEDGRKHRPKQIPETTIQQNQNVTDSVRERENTKAIQIEGLRSRKTDKKTCKVYLSISILLRPIDLPFPPLLHSRQAQPASSISLSVVLSLTLSTRRAGDEHCAAVRTCNEVRFQALWTRARTGYCRLLCQVKSTKS
jgi:hypothetical protein